MKRALIHIGVGKTGTTSIQAALAMSATHGGLDPITYPILRGRKSHQLLSLVYRDPERLERGLRSMYGGDAGKLAEFGDEVRRDFYKSLIESGDVILSSEFLENSTADEIRALHRDLWQRGFREFRVLVYVRHHGSLYVSRVQQILKASSSFPSPRDFEFQYESIISRWATVFGDVKCRDFSSDDVRKRGIVADFTDQMNGFFGTEITLSKLPPSNYSLSAESSIALQEFRLLHHPGEDDRFKADSDDFLKYLIDLEKGSDLIFTKVKLYTACLDWVAYRNANDIAYVNKLLGRHDSVVAGADALSGDGEYEQIAEMIDGFDADTLQVLRRSIRERHRT